MAINRNLDPWNVADDFIAFHHLESTDPEPIVRAIVTNLNYTPKAPRTIDSVFSDSIEFPITTPVLFNQPPNWEKFKSKFFEFNNALPLAELKLDLAVILEIQDKFITPDHKPATFVDCYVKLFQWPVENRFLVNDIFRLHLIQPFFASFCLHYLPEKLSSQQHPVIDSILTSINDKNDLALQLTSLRCFANMFSTVHGAELMFQEFNRINSHLSKNISSWNGLIDNRNVHLAFAAIWYNYSVMLTDIRKQHNIDFLDSLMNIVYETDGKTKHPEALALMLNTFGNLLVARGRSWFDLGLVQDFIKVIQSYPKQFDDHYDVKRAIQQINRLYNDYS